MMVHFAADRPAMRRRVQHLFLGQLFCDLRHAVTVDYHVENLADGDGGRFVNYPPLLVIFVA